MKITSKIKWACTALFVTVLLGGCNDWLDVNPRQEVKEKNIYTTEDGFKSVLTGVYIRLASSDLYSFNTSMYFPEVLTQHWELSTEGIRYELARFNYSYSDVEKRIETIYQAYYKCIAHLNNLLTALENESATVNFNYNNDMLMKGEALGLRAFLHLELLRFFGPVPINVNPATAAIPYVTEMTKSPNVLTTLTWGEVITRIEADLNAAEAMLKEIDPIIKSKNAYLNDPTVNLINVPEDAALQPEDNWQFYRQNRFNYYAVLGTKARFYHWVGNKEKAIDYANLVIEAKNRDDSDKFSLTTETSFIDPRSTFEKNGALVFSNEHLFAVHKLTLASDLVSTFTASDPTLRQTKALIEMAFETGLHPDDLRMKERRFWEEKTYESGRHVNHFYKYVGNDIGNPTSNTVPLLRLTEMYFIVMEDASLPLANDALTKYRIARNMNSFIDGSLTDEETVKERLEKEFRKDFFGEGQMFFFYKRHQYPAFTWPKNVTVPPSAYVIPLPKSQIKFE